MAQVSLNLNGTPMECEVDENSLLSTFLREDCGLTGTHIGCDTSQCGTCVVHINGQSVKSCSMLTLQADGADITTIEGIADGDDLHPMQAAFREHHGLQCGFCTAGMVMSAIDLLRHHPAPSKADIRAYMDGNICRCTGYHNIVKAIDAAAKEMAAR
ncbi:(2Fe-2S)-binding protein [Candidatus Puniceispirillum marinum]|uniref:(2Fe-2S)-binding protein n=1 Tax=Puniceispirillum marinum (strain IMCC1322) TaxID=488538 RepID=D5BNX2_PUNMI|nr:(2Fe-2S)-binding protein [Candidatus Puniceispirillum marinum]ADE40406.1 (2Fe-2S)-binding protein [Candidatus Puniceispirillum marinum IMCC1322]